MKAENISWDPRRLSTLREVLLSGPSGAKPMRIAKAISSGTGWRLSFEGIQNPEEARLYSGLWICIPESQATRPEGGWIEADLVGLPVVDELGSPCGTALGLADLPTLSLRASDPNNVERILPMEGPLACRVQREKGQIEVDREVWDAMS